MRIALCLSLLIIFFSLHGQESDATFPAKHELTFGGSIGGSRNQNEDSDNSSNQISIQPYALLQLDPHWQIGVCGSYSRSKVDRERTIVIDDFFFPRTETYLEETTNRQIGYCIFGRYTFNPQQQFNFFLEPGFSFNRGTLEFTSDRSGPINFSSAFFTRNVMIRVRPGVSYRFSPHWRASLFSSSIGYGLNWSKEEEEDRFDLNGTSLFYSLNLSSLRFAVEFTL